MDHAAPATWASSLGPSRTAWCLVLPGSTSAYQSLGPFSPNLSRRLPSFNSQYSIKYRYYKEIICMIIRVIIFWRYFKDILKAFSITHQLVDQSGILVTAAPFVPNVPVIWGRFSKTQKYFSVFSDFAKYGGTNGINRAPKHHNTNFLCKMPRGPMRFVKINLLNPTKPHKVSETQNVLFRFANGP